MHNMIETPIGKVTIAESNYSDLESVLKLWLEAASWLESLGIQQWKPSSFTMDSVEVHFSKTELFVAILKGEVIASFSLQWSDALIWGELDRDDAGYLHRLVVSRDYKGLDLGNLLLSWAGEYVKRKGKSKLRLDCMADNKILNDYYTRAGFEYMGRMEKKYFSASLFEKVIGTINDPSIG